MHTLLIKWQESLLLLLNVIMGLGYVKKIGLLDHFREGKIEPINV